MTAAGLNIRQLSIISGVPYTTLSRVVRGISDLDNMTVKNVQLIAAALNVPIESLLGATAEPMPADARELLGIYQTLTPTGRRIVLGLARQFAQEMSGNE